MKARIVSVTLALVGIAVLSALLAIQSARQTYAHEKTTSQVLHDYAALGAEGVGQRVQSALAGRLFGVVGALGDSLPASRAMLRNRLAAGPRAVSEAIAWVGQFTGNAQDPVASLNVVRFDSTYAPDAGIADSIRAVSRRMTQSAYMGTLMVHDQFIVFARPRAGATAGVFSMSTGAFRNLLQRLISSDPILPRAITHGVALGTNVQVDLNIRGTQVATRGNGAMSRYKAEYVIDGLFEGMTSVVTIAESFAPSLVVGGVPTSSGPLLLGAVALTVLLVAVAVYQLRQRDRLVRLREDFVTGTSHELRTPLAQIRLFAETLRLERVRNEDERMHAFSVIEREAKRLEHLVDNLLHFSRSDRLTLHAQREFVNAATLTREIAAEFQPLAAKAEVSIVLDGVAATSAQVDSAPWRQILLNLLDNAVKYGGRRSTVTIELTDNGKDVLLVVTDQGPGVPMAERSNIWKKFWRAESSRVAGISGAGIGLATVHDLVAHLGGVCFVDGAIPTGARFHVVVPKSI